MSVRRRAPLRRLRHVGEYLFARALLAAFGALPLDCASALGGRIGRAIGPLLPIARVARGNLAAAFPERTPAEREAIIAAMWDNLGRVLAEYPHLARLRAGEADARIEIAGEEHLRALRDDGVGGFCVGGHIGNWEIPSVVAARAGLPTVELYRPLNNTLLDRYLRRLRAATGGRHFAKGAQAARATLAALRRGDHIGILVDQKLNEGVPVPFFGRDAMTTDAPARLALRHGVPIVCIRMERLRGAYFRFTIRPLPLRAAGDRAAEAARATRAINAILEEWVRERPEQWLWLHRRWPPAASPASAPPPARDRGARRTS